ncbi:MAG: tetratricopeptide repeat protein [candidate division Zixibacteria bacterium]|nr:tetratricopeptide repeat protein [candidate division Zixibacteria bacterium]
MQNKVKLSKRQIKEDKFTTFMLESKQKFQDNWQFYVIGIVGVILVIAAVAYYINSQATKEEESAYKFARALLDYRNGNNQIAILSLNQIVDDYGSSTVAREATFMLGQVNYENKNYAEAIRFFEKYSREYRDDKYYLAAALAGIAASYENQGSYTEAGQKFADACEAFPDGPLYGDYQLGAVRNFVKADNFENARAHLDIILDKYKGTAVAIKAERMFYEKGRPQPQT